jgi:hypothetical protein
MSLLPAGGAPADMTRRARAYLMIGGLRHALIGIFAIGWSDQFTNAAYLPVVSYAPMWLWGGAMLAIAVVMGLAAKLRKAGWARVGLIASASITLALGSGLSLGIIGAWADGKTATPILAILLLALAAKDFAVCTQPMRSPFEPLMGRRSLPL